ncbi:MAG TPA: tripartite tricarboxylate transporter substrate binding protein [Burkholderiales bacterium]
MIIALCLLLAQGAYAAFPEHPIRLVIPSGAGGVTDTLARAMAIQLSADFGQQVYIDNRPGASGIVGSEVVATAAPDGYTLLMVFPSHAVNPSLFRRLPYDTVKSFAPVSLVSNVSMVMVVNRDFAGNSVKQLIDVAKSHPGQLNFGSVGSGSLGHLGAELFASTAGIKIVHVAYKGSPQVLTALLAGEVNLYLVASASSVVPHIRSGRIKALGVSSKKRLEILPEVPTISETLPNYEVSGWNGILAPAGTPRATIEVLQKAIAKVVKSADFTKRLTAEGAVGVGSTPEEMEAVLKADIAKWAAVVKAAGIKAE